MSPGTPSIDDAPRRGRPRDPQRDAAIIEAAIELVVEVGYDRLTIEQVAVQAGVGKATIYRRWESKAELVIDAIGHVKRGMDAVDTGTLEGDLAGMMTFACSAPAQQANALMLNVAPALSRDPELLATFRERFTEPRIARIQAMLERARDRGELGADVDLEMAASLLPSLMLQRALLTGESAGADYARRIVGSLLRPALGLPPTAYEPTEQP
ncbi:MAG: TetR/AcrR family transcriptional regulator [Thermoleophilia bacterium]|nr:TetR/AcrR family transcriptional regulator [Thermoleophilia bacterium]